MKNTIEFPSLLEAFFTKRLMAERKVSPHTISSYRDTFRLLVQFAQKRLGKPPSLLGMDDLNASFVGSFLDDIESNRANTTRCRNLRLTAIRSFFRYAALESPQHAGLIQRVLAIPNKRHTRGLVSFLTRPEIEALLAAPDQRSRLGRRDHALLLMAIQTGFRVSELTSIRQRDVCFGKGPYIRCMGKGRKERCTPLTKTTAAVVKAWTMEQGENQAALLFGGGDSGNGLSADAVQHLVSKYAKVAQNTCPSLVGKRVSPHVLRHTTAMELLQAGVDRSLIALWLGHESVETTQIYLRCQPGTEGRDLGQD